MTDVQSGVREPVNRSFDKRTREKRDGGTWLPRSRDKGAAKQQLSFARPLFQVPRHYPVNFAVHERTYVTYEPRRFTRTRVATLVSRCATPDGVCASRIAGNKEFDDRSSAPVGNKDRVRRGWQRVTARRAQMANQRRGLWKNDWTQLLNCAFPDKTGPAMPEDGLAVDSAEIFDAARLVACGRRFKGGHALVGGLVEIHPPSEKKMWIDGPPAVS